jgi:hypothetical protein
MFDGGSLVIERAVVGAEIKSRIEDRHIYRLKFDPPINNSNPPTDFLDSLLVSNRQYKVEFECADVPENSELCVLYMYRKKIGKTWGIDWDKRAENNRQKY